MSCDHRLIKWEIKILDDALKKKSKKLFLWETVNFIKNNNNREWEAKEENFILNSCLLPNTYRVK